MDLGERGILGGVVRRVLKLDKAGMELGVMSFGVVLVVVVMVVVVVARGVVEDFMVAIAIEEKRGCGSMRGRTLSQCTTSTNIGGSLRKERKAVGELSSGGQRGRLDKASQPEALPEMQSAKTLILGRLNACCFLKTFSRARAR